MTATNLPDRILLIDDEPDLQRLVVFNLREAGFEADAVGTGADGIAAAVKNRPSVVILDLMLPDIPGAEVCRRMRLDPTLADVPIMMLTARGDEYDRVLGFEVGADDYVVKPFSVRELVLRVRAVVRRAKERQVARDADRPGASGVDGEKRLTWRGLEVDLRHHHVYADGAEIALRPLEFKLIAILLEEPGRVFTRSQLLEEVWGITGDVHTRTVDTHVRRLREKLGKYGEAVETVHCVGYRLRDVRKEGA